MKDGNLLLECCILQECSHYASIQPAELAAAQPSEGLEEGSGCVDNDNEPISGFKENCLASDDSTPQHKVVEGLLVWQNMRSPKITREFTRDPYRLIFCALLKKNSRQKTQESRNSRKKTSNSSQKKFGSDEN